MWTGAILVASIPWLFLDVSVLSYRILSIFLIAPLFAVSFLLISGLLSWPAHKAIIRGKFPRQPFHKIYFWRRIYGCCWTTVYYFKPLYSVFLTIPVLKRALFRIFGYKGPLNFVIYPDTWVRDLPLLYLGQSAYCSNRSTIGTNLCLKDGTILVDRIYIGDRAILGHLAAIAPGVKMDEDVELGVATVVGVRSRFKKNTKIGSACAINHGVTIGENCTVGGHASIDLGVKITDNIKIPSGCMLPPGTIISQQSDVDKYLSLENQILHHHVSEVAEKLASQIETLSLK
jgi:acetyltransferase-like isoleucine patch superfamily enzyme